MGHAYLNAIREGMVLFAGVAVREITPAGSVFLSGYPHVRRYSTGVHDPLLSSALYLEAGGERVMFIANDVIYVSKRTVESARRRIAQAMGIPEGHILISATHTHSGPKTLDPIATEADEAVPRADQTYVSFLEDRIVEAGVEAARNLLPAEIGVARADATGVGTNRRDPAGPRDLEMPVMVVKALDGKALACMLVCSMHPTVMHEDSTLISGDFPGLARQILQKTLGEQCAVLYHTGPAGDQSPRHVTRANTFGEAERLGRILAEAAAKVIPSISFRRNINLECRRAFAELPLKTFPDEASAHAKLEKAVARLAQLRETNAPRTQVRTAEVDWFGAQEVLTLARAAAQGRLDAVAKSCMPAEVQTILVGPWTFVAWPGEMFVEFSLNLKSQISDCFPISYANGELQGYLVTRAAADEGGYESSNAIFRSPESGEMIVEHTIRLLQDRCNTR